MTTLYQEFDDPEGDIGDGEYIADDGFVSAGCVKLTGLGFQAVGVVLMGGETVVPGASVWFGYNIFQGNGAEGNATIRVVIEFDDGGDSFDEEIGVLPQTAGWHLYTKDVSAYEDQVLTGINITCLPAAIVLDDSTNYCYIDSIRSFPDDEPLPEDEELSIHIVKFDGAVFYVIENEWEDDVCVGLKVGLEVEGVRALKALRKTTSEVKFYSGDDALTFRSDLPIPSSRQANFALRDSDAEVLVGSDVEDAILVVEGSPSDTYTSWTDLTDSLPADTTITGVIWI